MNTKPGERSYRSSRSWIFFKIGALKNFANFKGKYLCSSLFLIKLQAWSLVTLSDCNWTRTQNHLVRKITLYHLAKLAEWLSCVLRLILWCIWLYVLLMSRTRFRVNPQYIVACMSRNSLLKAGAKSEV